jgi:hypothetical protein
MRNGKTILFGSIAALAVLGTPVLAKNSDAQKATEKSTASSSCQAYQQAADGSWTPLPCQEMGAGAASPHKPAARSEGEEAR